MLKAATLFALSCVSALGPGQNGAPPAPAASPKTVLSASTQLVVVDVVVQDSSGKPVHGLTRDDFQITENKAPQSLRNFETYSSGAPAEATNPAPPIPAMPPGVFTDYTPLKPNAPLNIILIDSLNTPMTDQAYVRQQLAEYVKHADPHGQTAIFGLNSRLVLLQGFTSDPRVLRAAVEHKLIPRSSHVLDDPGGTNTDSNNLSGQMSDLAADNPQLQQTVANLQQFEAEQASFQTRLRTQYTLDAFNQLARYLDTFPGRKNLIWFSGSFPLTILPDSTLQDPFAVISTSEDEYRETANLLTRSQVAVYPVDARGLMTNPVFSASRSGSEFARSPNAMSKSLQEFFQSQASEHQTMDQMATDTGGHAFYNTNGLAQAVREAFDSGSNYYTLTYSPTDHNWNGAYRTIRISLSGAAAARGLKLSYRHGYYAFGPDSHQQDASRAPVTGQDSKIQQSRNVYLHAAMARGAPTPSELLFKVRVLPASTGTEDKLAPDNQADPSGSFKAPYRRYMIDVAALPQDFSWTRAADGKYQADVVFDTLIYDSGGRLLNLLSKETRMNVDVDNLKRLLQQGLQVHMDVSAPPKGDHYFRVVVRDVRSNRIGALEVPVSSVSSLAPPPPVAPTRSGSAAISGASPTENASPAPH